jgi:hypothetical protein
LDGVLPTDLKQVRIEIVPDEGNRLNPGETGSLNLWGTFGSQQSAASAILDMTVEAFLNAFSNEIRHFLDGLPGVDLDLRRNVVKEAYDLAAEVIADAGLELGDRLLNISRVGALPWIHDVPVDPSYYNYKPSNLLMISIPLTPLAGPTILGGVQRLLNYLLPGDISLTQDVITVDNPEIISYDRDTGKVRASSAVGKTTVHARVYRFDKVKNFLWQFPIEAWVYLEEGDIVQDPGGSSLETNTPLEVSVTNENDPVYSDLNSSPVSGVVPGVFTTDGGSFQISVSPVDSNGDLLYDQVSLDSFSFSPIQVTPLSDPRTPVARGMATPDYIETTLPPDPTTGVSVAILLDSSGSMDWNDPARQRVVAAKALIDILRPKDKAAVLDFGAGSTRGFSYTRLLQEFTSDHYLLYQAVDRVVANDGTPMYQSLRETISYIQATGLPNPALLVLTDGLADDDHLFGDVVTQAQGIGLPIFTVGLGSEIDFTQLQALAVRTGGTFAAATDAAGLQSLFENLGVAFSAGRIIVHGSGTFLPSLQNLGQYIVSGELYTKISGRTLTTPFDFVVEVVSVADGLALKMLANSQLTSTQE